MLNEAGCSSGAESVVAGQSARIHHLTQELVKERQATATLKAKMAEQQRMLCKDLQASDFALFPPTERQDCDATLQ